MKSSSFLFILKSRGMVDDQLTAVVMCHGHGKGSN
jgi:hypothetical protein